MLRTKRLLATCLFAAIVASPLSAPAQAQTPAPAPAQQHSAEARAAAPLSCMGDILLAAGDDATQLYEGVTGSGTIDFQPVGPATEKYNGMGVNPDDKFVYAIDRTTLNLLRIDDAGAVTDLGSVGLPTPTTGANSYAAGAFDDAGNYYVANGYDDRMYRIDVATKQSTEIVLSETLGGVIDFAYSDGYFWGAARDGSIARITPGTGEVSTYPGVLPNASTGVDGYGGAFTYGNGDLGFYRNSGSVLRVAFTDPASPSFQLLSTQTAPMASSSVDATSCFDRPVDLGVVKSGPATVAPGGDIAYTITLTNHGPNPSSGWTLSDPIPAGLAGAATTTEGCSIASDMLSCTGGALAVGDSVEIELTGHAADGATKVVNTATVFGNDPDPNPDNDKDTAITEVKEEPGLEIVKKQEGPQTVKAGATVRYTTTVTNTGNTTYTDANPARFTDDLSDLLDDARYNQDASATRGTVNYQDPNLSWSGPLTPGQSATITFSITTDARPFGDTKLRNTVVSDTPGNNCPTNSRDPRCMTLGKVDARDKDKK